VVEAIETALEHGPSALKEIIDQGGAKRCQGRISRLNIHDVE
jgi:hypothetical protein